MVTDRIAEALAAVERREQEDSLQRQISLAIRRSFWAFFRRERAKDTRQ